MTHGTSPTPQQPSPALQAYTQASQNCRDIAAEVGVRNCDDDLNWRAAELVAEDRFSDAQAAGHSIDEILKAGRAR
ncbi:hypothetical protein [Streptomyces naphthomycinicus]|uniref:hypothetical protein n=1 Tax=Streptomyces naphthomycinicus TaxID=2872625 RepID=UPI001CEC4652|nr:hypothetical protein [Streptomyces sp. TML10]